MTEIYLNPDCELRQWCLERAFETRALKGVAHMEVTNVAEDYYRWIIEGVSQSNRQVLVHAEKPCDDPDQDNGSAETEVQS